MFTKHNHILEQKTKEFIQALTETAEFKAFTKAQDVFNRDEKAKKNSLPISKALSRPMPSFVKGISRELRIKQSVCENYNIDYNKILRLRI